MLAGSGWGTQQKNTDCRTVQLLQKNKTKQKKQLFGGEKAIIRGEKLQHGTILTGFGNPYFDAARICYQRSHVQNCTVLREHYRPHLTHRNVTNTRLFPASVLQPLVVAHHNFLVYLQEVLPRASLVCTPATERRPCATAG